MRFSAQNVFCATPGYGDFFSGHRTLSAAVQVSTASASAADIPTATAAVPQFGLHGASSVKSNQAKAEAEEEKKKTEREVRTENTYTFNHSDFLISGFSVD